MRPFARCLVLVLPFLAGCKGQLAEFTVNLAADGSGDCEVAGIREVQLVTDPRGKPDAILQGTKDAQTFELGVRVTKAKFAAIKDLGVGDIAFSVDKQDGRNLLTVRIPAGSGSKWFGAFGFSERSLEVWNQMEAQSKKDNEARRKVDPKASISSFEAPRPPNVLFRINLPGKLEGQGFETVPLGLMPKLDLDRGERMASISIPIAEIHANKMKEVIWKISYAAE